MNRLTVTKVDSTYLGCLTSYAQCIIYYVCGRARTHDHRIGSQAPYTIASHKLTSGHISFIIYIFFMHSPTTFLAFVVFSLRDVFTMIIVAGKVSFIVLFLISIEILHNTVA